MDYNGSVMKRVALFLIVAGAAVAMVACQGAVGKTGETGPEGPAGPTPPAPPPENLAPQARELTLDPVLMMEGDPPRDVNVAINFFDPDGDDPALVLSYSVAQTAMYVDVALADGILTITPVDAGKAVITVTATDSGGLTASAMFTVEVGDAGMPMFVGPLLGATLTFGEQHTISSAVIESAFRGEAPLIFSAETEHDTIVMVTKAEDDNTVIITALNQPGTATVTITATDGDGEQDSHSIKIEVRASLAPVVSSTMPDPVTLDVGGDPKEVDVAPYFDNHGLEALTYTAAASSDDDAVTVSIAGSMLTITPMGEGTATVTVTAFNTHGSAEQMISATVEGTPPEREGTIEDRTIASGDTLNIIIGDYFTPGAVGDSLTYTVHVGGTTGTTALISGGDTLVITAGPTAGEAIITVTATDGEDETAEQMFSVTVTEEGGLAPTNPTPIPPQTSDIGASTKTTIDVSGYFTGADSYTAVSRNPDKVMATATTAGIVTLTPFAHGTARVRVTASNSAGSISDEFDVTVRAPAKFEMDKSLPDLRIQVRGSGGTPEGKEVLDDLSKLFTDPDDPSATLKFTTTTSDATKVQVVKLAGTRVAETTTPTTPPTGDPATDKAVTVMGNDVVLFARAVGTAKITVKVTDSDELSIMKSFMVTVTEEQNAIPAAVDLTTDTDDSLKNNLPDLIGANRLKLSESKVVIDDKAIENYFTDGDLERPSGDLLKFSVEYYKGATGPTVAAGVVTYAEGSKIDDDDDDLVATATVMPMTWDGDDFGSSDKFTVTVTPKKAGGSTTVDNAESQGIVIIATDLSGMKALQTFEVQVNNPPVAHGPTEASKGDAQKTLAKLSKTYMDLGKASGFSQISATAHTITMVAANANDDDYFSDKDGDDESAALNCRFDLSGADIFPDVTGTTPVDYPKWADATVRKVLQLAANGTTAFKNQGTAHIDVWCKDAARETSPKARLTITVTSAGSIHQ